MNTIPLEAIQISPNRQRRTFDEAQHRELVTSIEENGLLQAIVLRQEGETHVLVSGERRLRALRDIFDLGGTVRHDSREVPMGQVPFTLITALDSFARELAELDENLRRSNLTWDEEAAAVARVLQLRTEQALAKGEPAPTHAQIAEEVSAPARAGFSGTSAYGAQEVRKQVAVSRHLADPDVAKAKTLDDAYKLLKKREEQKRDAARSAQVGATFNSSMHVCVEGDSRAYLQGMGLEQYDCILTDPPYGIDAQDFGDSGGKAVSQHTYQDDEAYLLNLVADIGPLLFTLTKPQAHLYWFCDIDRFHFLRTAFSAHGWWVHRTPIVWHKPLANGIPWPEHGPRRTWELILYAVKGKRPTLKQSAPDVITYPSDPNLGHSAQKPVALFRELLSRTCRAGDAVLDPFCGTGPIFPAAHELKVRATGVERDPVARGIALGRLEKLL